MPDFRTIERELVEFFQQAGGTVWRDNAVPFMHAAVVADVDLENIGEEGVTPDDIDHGDRIERGEHVSLEALARRLEDLWK